MNEDEAYLNISKRYLESCEQHISNGVNLQEVIGFKGYHAFESIAGAFNSHFGHTVPKSHVKKLNSFVAHACHSRHINGMAIATLAMTFNGVRNLYLYPEKDGSNYKVPMNSLSMTNAKELVRRVKGIVKKIEKLV